MKSAALIHWRKSSGLHYIHWRLSLNTLAKISKLAFYQRLLLYKHIYWAYLLTTVLLYYFDCLFTYHFVHYTCFLFFVSCLDCDVVCRLCIKWTNHNHIQVSFTSWLEWGLIVICNLSKRVNLSCINIWCLMWTVIAIHLIYLWTKI